MGQAHLTPKPPSPLSPQPRSLSLTVEPTCHPLPSSLTTASGESASSGVASGRPTAAHLSPSTPRKRCTLYKHHPHANHPRRPRSAPPDPVVTCLPSPSNWRRPCRPDRRCLLRSAARTRRCRTHPLLAGTRAISPSDFHSCRRGKNVQKRRAPAHAFDHAQPI